MSAKYFVSLDHILRVFMCFSVFLPCFMCFSVLGVNWLKDTNYGCFGVKRSFLAKLGVTSVEHGAKVG